MITPYLFALRHVTATRGCFRSFHHPSCTERNSENERCGGGKYQRHALWCDERRHVPTERRGQVHVLNPPGVQRLPVLDPRPTGCEVEHVPATLFQFTAAPRLCDRQAGGPHAPPFLSL